MDKEFLKQKAKEVRIDIINMLAEAGSGHPGGVIILCRYFNPALF